MHELSRAFAAPDEMEKFMAAEIAKWAQVVKDAGITPQ